MADLLRSSQGHRVEHGANFHVDLEKAKLVSHTQ